MFAVGTHILSKSQMMIGRGAAHKSGLGCYYTYKKRQAFAIVIASIKVVVWMEFGRGGYTTYCSVASKKDDANWNSSFFVIFEDPPFSWFVEKPKEEAYGRNFDDSLKIISKWSES
jgi:hypothetical protein